MQFSRYYQIYHLKTCSCIPLKLNIKMFVACALFIRVLSGFTSIRLPTSELADVNPDNTRTRVL